MRRINFKEPTHDSNWKKWRERCLEATQQLKAAFMAGRNISIADLYKEPTVKKEYYITDNEEKPKPPFYNKCVYCDLSIRNQYGDIEHYRPKKSVAENKNHPGYFWLAYEWKNLFPSCVTCNQKIKRDKFPLVDESKRALLPDDSIEKEEPALLHPLYDDPEEHLSVEVFTGLIYGKTKRGKRTIDFFKMNDRDDLFDGRGDAIKLTKSLNSEFDNAIAQNNIAEIKKILTRLWGMVNGSENFTLSTICFMQNRYGKDDNGKELYLPWLKGMLEQYKIL